MTMDPRENMDAFPIYSEFSDPDRAIAELFGEDVLAGGRYSTDDGDRSMQDGYACDPLGVPMFANHYPATDTQAPKTFAPTTALRPSIYTHQFAYTSSSSNQFGYMQEQSYTVSPTTLDNHNNTLEDYNNIIVTPPQGQSPQFDVGLGVHTQLKTPSLDSGTTYATQSGFINNDAQQVYEPEFPWMAGFASSTPELDNLPSTLSPGTHVQGPTGTKRRSVDLGDTENRPKRAKSVKNGFECEHPACKRRFNRACDARKHYGNVHGDKTHKCGFDTCESRFPYPKDVRRHMKQVHNIDFPAPQDEKKPRRRFSSLKSVVSMLQNLQLWSKDPTENEEAEDYILVTRDHKDFRKVYLRGAETSEALMREIGSVFGIHLGHVDDARLRRCGSGGTLGKHILGTQLMAAAKKAVAAGKTLELLFTPTHDVKNAA